MRFRLPVRAAFAVLAVVLVASLVVPLPAAQRARAAVYDAGRQVTLAGTVTRVEWVNPAAFVFVDVRDATGAVTGWAIEIGPPLELERGGWSSRDLRLGDQVTVTGIPARDAAHRAFGLTVALAGSGRRLFAPPAPPVPPAEDTPPPRWPDGQIRLGPPEGATGYWGPATARGLVERTGATIPMDADGLLLDLGDAGRVAPFQPWARALYVYRQRTRLADDPLGRCVPPGGPRQFHMPNGFQFVEQRDLGRILVLLGGGNRNWRVIHTDGRPAGQADEVVLTYYGTSAGRWEEDTLVVDSVGYNERFWFTSGGLPHTESLHLLERFTRTGLHTLEYEVTVEDPRTYTRPWTGGWTVRWVPDDEIEEFFCEEGADATASR